MSRVRRRPPTADLLVLAAILVWSVNVIVVKVALRSSPPVLYTTTRYLLGGVLLLAVVRVTAGRLVTPRSRRDLGAMAVAGALGIAANQASFSIALRFTTAVDVSLIIGATPLAVAAYGALAGRERIGRRAWGGLMVGAAGLVLVVGTGAGGHGSLAGDLIALGAPVSWAFYLGRLSKLLPRYPVMHLSAWVTVLGTMPLLPIAGGEASVAPPHPSWPLLGFVLFSGVLAVAFCNLAYYRGLANLGATRVAAYTYLQPFLGAVAAFLILGETLRPLQLLGGAVVVLGVVLGRPRPRPIEQQASVTADPLLEGG